MNHLYFHAYLADKLIENDVPVETLAEALKHGNRTFVLGWLGGKRLPRPVELPKIAEVLGAPIEEVGLVYLADLIPEPSLIDYAGKSGMWTPSLEDDG